MQVAAVRAAVAAGRRHSVLCFSHDVICEVKKVFIVILPLRATAVCFSHDVICKVKKVFIVILTPKPSLDFRTGWSVGEHDLA